MIMKTKNIYINNINHLLYDLIHIYQRMECRKVVLVSNDKYFVMMLKNILP